MAGFDLLNRNLDSTGRYFLEASAGTGKTFAIETLVVRLLMESDEFKLSHILLVTFTKAATEELKVRVMKRLKETLTLLDNGEELPDFLSAIKERGDEELIMAKKRVARALASFDKAKIFTLHGFCLYALRRHAPLSHLLLKEIAPSNLIDEVTKDFLRTQSQFSERELTLLLNHFGQDMDALFREIRRLVEKRVPIKSGKSEEELLSLVKKECEKLNEKYRPEPSALLSDLLSHAKGYKGMCDRKKEIKEEIKEGFSKWVDFFFSPSSLPRDCPLSEMSEENRLKKPISEPLHYPGFVEEMQKTIEPLIRESLDPLLLLLRLAEGVKRALDEKIEKEELFFYQDLILKMKKAVEAPSFNHFLRHEFRALFIDEFQDVDSDLWKIFSTLFISRDFSGPIYFIGDPKQSIYRFRGADLYSYEKAKKSFCEAKVASLAINFRSQPKLLSSLNHLFSSPHLFLLPRTKESLIAPPLASGIKREPRLSDSRAAVHFFKAEKEEELFHFIASEVSHLQKSGVALSECAVLVRDRAQKERFLHFASTHLLPVTSSRGRLLVDSPALFFLMDLINAAEPKERRALAKLALWPNFVFDSAREEEFIALTDILKEEGLLPWFCALLEKGWVKGEEEFFSDLFQLVELMAEARVSPDRRISFLEKLNHESEDSESLRARATSQEAVQLLTIHASKGLEFEVVFPLGLISEHRERRELLFDPASQAITLSDEALLSHHEEEAAEAFRLLYVAMTRAKERLYLPFIEKKKNSLISLFLQKRLEGQSLENFCNEKEGFSFSFCEEKKEEIKIVKEKKEERLLAPSLPLPSFPSHFQHSFSSLCQRHSTLISMPHEKSTLLPSGKAFGSFLHELMEDLPWEEAVEAKSAEEIAILLSSHFALTAYSDFMLPICELIYKTLHAPLLGPHSFSLSEINPTKFFRELEFLYSEEGDMIKGFIDLLFEHEGKIYFVDWKTNDLGDQPENYSKENLARVMEAHDYTLQATLYQRAINRYFSQFAPALPFGGGFFLFVRGIDEKGNGIYVCS